MDLEKMKQNTTGIIFRFAVPSIIIMVLTSLATVADGFFIGNYVDKEGITFGISIYFMAKEIYN